MLGGGRSREKQCSLITSVVSDVAEHEGADPRDGLREYVSLLLLARSSGEQRPGGYADPARVYPVWLRVPHADEGGDHV
jgi:hypothetical protein